MSTENIVIKTTETGARQVARNIEAIGTTSSKAQAQITSMVKTLAGLNAAANALKGAQSQMDRMNSIIARNAETQARVAVANDRSAASALKLATENQKLQAALAKVETELHKAITAQNNATVSAQNLAAAQMRASTAAQQFATEQQRTVVAATNAAIAQQRLATEVQKTAIATNNAAVAQQRLLTEQQRTLAGANNAAAAAQRLATEQQKTATQTAKLNTAQNQAATSAQKLATELHRTAQAASQAAIASTNLQIAQQRLAITNNNVSISAIKAEIAEQKLAQSLLQTAIAEDRAAISAIRLREAQAGLAAGAGRAGGSILTLNNALQALASLLMLSQLTKWADSWIMAEGKVNIFTHSATETTMVMDRLFEIAQKTRQPIDGIASSFHQLSIAGAALGASQNELLQFTEAVGNAFAIQGTDSNTARGGIIQLGQAMNEGIVRAQEYNSMINAMPIVLKTVANHLDGAGGSLAKLRKMMLDGKLTSRDFFNALLKGQDDLKLLFERSGKTFGQAFTIMENGLKRYIGELNKSTGASRAFYDASLVVANNIGNIVNALIALAAPRIIGGLVNVTRQLWLMAAAAAANPYATIGAAIIVAVTALALFKDQLVVTQVGLEDCTVASVTLGDYMSAAWDMGKEGAVSLAGYLKGEFLSTWSLVKENWKGAGPIFESVAATVGLNINTMIGTFVGFGKSIGMVLAGIPAAFKDTMVQAGNGMIGALESTINKAIELSNTMRAKVGLDAFSMVSIDRIDNPNAGKASQLGSEVKEAFTSSLNVDYIGLATKAVSDTVGGVLDDLNTRALATAKERQRIAAADKKLQDEINLDAKNGNGENFAGNTKQTAAEKKAEKAAESLRKWVAEQKAATDAANGMATAYLAGGDAVSKLSREQEIETEVAKRGEIARKKVTNAVNAHHDALERLDIAKAVNDTRLETDDLIAQTSVIRAQTASLAGGKAAQDAYNISKAESAIIAGKNSAAYEKERQQLEDQTRALNDAKTEYAAVTEIAGLVDSTANAQEKYNKQLEHFKSLEAYAKTPQELEAIRRAIIDAKNETSIWAQMTEGAVDRIDSSFADMWKNVFDGTKSTLDGMKSAMKQWLAEVAHMLLTKPLMISFGNMLLGTNKSGGIGEVMGQLFGNSGGTGSGFTDILSMGQKAYGIYNSGLGQAISSGWASGDGFIGGLQNAWSSGSGYISGALGMGTGAAGAAASTGLTQGAAAFGSQFGTGIGAASFPGAASAAAGGASSGAGAAAGGLSGAANVGYGIGGAIMGYQQAGLKGAATGALGAVGGANAGAALGTVILPGIGTAIGAALGAVLGGTVGASIWGGDWQTKDQGIQLAVTDNEFVGNQFEYQKKKGGLFGKNKKRTRLSALDPEMQSALDAAYDATEGSVLSLFDRLNVQLNDGVLDGLNIAASQISTKDKTAEQIQEEITKWFGGVADFMTVAVANATGSGTAGYDFKALTEFVNNLYGVNDVLKHLNVGLFDISVTGGFMAEQLSAWAGGIENLRTMTATYYDKFFTDAEKSANILSDVREEFENIGVTLPASRKGYREMVEGIDKTTEAGRAMFLTLIKLSGDAAMAFDILESSASTTKEALANNVTSAFGTLQRSINAQKEALTTAYNDQVTAINTAITSTSDAISNLTSLTGDLDAALKALQAQSVEATRILYGQAKAAVTAAVATVNAGGTVKADDLKDPLNALATNSDATYTTWEAFARDQGESMNLIAILKDKSEYQLTTQEMMLESLQNQLKTSKDQYDDEIKRLDKQLDFAQSQLDALNGVNTSVLGVAAAIAGMNAAVMAALASKSGLASGATGANNGNTNNGALLETIYQSVLGRDTDAEGLAYWKNQLGTGAVTYDGLAEAIKKDALTNGELKGYATGGYAGAGMAIFGEEGPEMVDLSRGYVHTASDTRSILNSAGDDIVEVLYMLIDEVRTSNNYAEQTTVNTAKTARTVRDIRDQSNLVGDNV